MDEVPIISLDPQVYLTDLVYISAQTAFGVLPWILLQKAGGRGAPPPPAKSLQLTGLAGGLLAFGSTPTWLRLFTHGELRDSDSIMSTMAPPASVPVVAPVADPSPVAAPMPFAQKGDVESTAWSYRM